MSNGGLFYKWKRDTSRINEKAASIGLLLGECGAHDSAKSHGSGKRPWWLFCGKALCRGRGLPGILIVLPKGTVKAMLQQAQVCLPRIWLLTMKEGSRSDRIRSQTGQGW